MELCSMLCVSLDGREVCKRVDICMCMTESLCCSPETITTLLIGYAPTQNKKFKQKTGPCRSPALYGHSLKGVGQQRRRVVQGSCIPPQRTPEILLGGNSSRNQRKLFYFAGWVHRHSPTSPRRSFLTGSAWCTHSKLGKSRAIQGQWVNIIRAQFMIGRLGEKI